MMGDGLGKVFGGKPFAGCAAADQVLELIGVVRGSAACSGQHRQLIAQQRGQQRAALVAAGRAPRRAARPGAAS